MNEVLKTIRNRRTVRRFKPDPIDEEKLQMILEAGRWAPSFSNLQPWKFIVVKDQGLKNALDKAAKESVLHLGINEAPVVILVCVDRRIDPLHAIETGAAATQNMTLAAYSLGLGTGWIGIWGTEAEASIQKILKLPDTVRVVSLIPVGVSCESPPAHRKPLEELIKLYWYHICDDPKFIKSMKDIGQPVMYLGPADFGNYLQAGFEQYGKLIKKFNIKLQ